MATCNIRYANSTDADTIMELIRDLARYEKAEDKVVATTADILENIFEKKVAEVILAFEDTKPVGFMLFFHTYSTWVGKPGIYLEDFYVKEECRKKGYGKALFKTLANIALERNCGRIEWACLDWNTPSIGFYKALGAVGQEDWTTYRLTVPEIENIAKK